MNEYFTNPSALTEIYKLTSKRYKLFLDTFDID